MASAAAQLLDQLMGTTRNAVPGDNVRELSWSDDEVCKYYLCGFCPSDLFINTKAEASVGPCYKVHDEHLKKLYEESNDAEYLGYEDTFLSYLERLVRDLDKKVDRGKDRLRRSAEAKQQSLSGRGGPGGQSSEKLKQLSQDIDELVLELQLLGDMGRVEETQNLMVKLEEMERERESERITLNSSAPPKILAGFELDANDFHEKMELCDVCGSFLVIGDTQSRVDAHLLGKQHLGFSRIRTTIAELKLKKAKRFKAKQDEIANRRQEREQGSRYRRNSHRSHSKDRRTSHRSSSRERASRRSSSHRRKRHSLKSRSSSRDKRRSRSRSRKRRSTSKSRSRSRGRKRVRSRSRNRRKSRSKSSGRRRSQSKSRVKRRSRSKSREKRRSSKKVDEKKAEGTSQEIMRSRSRSKEKPKEEKPKEYKSKEEKHKDSRTGANGNN